MSELFRRLDKDLMGGLDNLVAGVKELQKVLTNPEITSYRVVLNPEKMVLKEALKKISGTEIEKLLREHRVI